MADGKKRRSKSLTPSSNIPPAIIPPVAFSAVPRTSVEAPNNTWGMDPNLNATLTRSGTLPRLFATQQPPADEDIFSDPESSLYDYKLMDEAGYSTVEFGTWPRRGQNRQDTEESPGVRRRSRPAFNHQPAQTDQGFYHVLEENNNAVYAVPNKRKFKKSVVIEDEMTLDRTREDVKERMKEFQDSPYTETMQRPTAGTSSRKSPAMTKRSSGRKAKSKKMEGDDIDALARCLDDQPIEVREQKISPQVNRKKEQALHREPMRVKQSARNQQSNNPSTSTKNVMKEKSGHQSDRSRTGSTNDKDTLLVREHTLHINMENERLQQENAEMAKELETLREVATAVSEGDTENAVSLLSKKGMDDMREENEQLKSTVHRLNIELSKYQCKYRKLEEEEVLRLKSLPSTGPIPSWLINQKYLSPLLLAYDDELRTRDECIGEYQHELELLKERAQNIIEENQKLRIQGGYGNEIGPINGIEWQQLQEQARLVLEENQILMEQIEVLQNKSKDMYNAHIQEVTRLTKKLSAVESEKVDIERNMEELKLKLREVKHKNDVLVMSSETQVSVQEHVNTIANLKRSLNEDREIYERESETLKNKVKAAESEQKALAKQVADVTAENRQLHAQLKMMERTNSKAQQKLTVFHKAVEQSENKEMITQEQLANIIKVAELTALERDTYAKVAKDQEKESKQTLNKMLEKSVTVGKLEERLKLYKIKAATKLSTVAERFKEQEEAFLQQKQEYEREIRYLRLIISEKEQLLNSVINEKKNVEEDLENMWQAANSENMRLKDTIRRTRTPNDDVLDIDDYVDDPKLPADDDD